jgi:hypothetical protein
MFQSPDQIADSIGLNKRLINTIWDSIKIFIVDGAYVRDNYDADFLLGGHYVVYKFIPENEIWIEAADDMEENLAHELFELLLMKYCKIGYNEAHLKALSIEKVLRQVK